MGRIGAFLIHLGISLIIFAVLAYLVLFVWYPDFFFASDGGWQGIRIIVFVDLVLGPTLTLVVFNRSKPAAELRRDLTIIVTIQVVCLLAGTYVVYAERPIALVYVDGRFYSMTARAYEAAGVEVPDLASFPGPWPKRIVVDLPTDPLEQSEVRRAAMAEAKPLRTLTNRYVPMTYELLNAEQEAYQISELADRLKKPEQLLRWLDGQSGGPDQYAIFDYGTRQGFALLAVSKQTGNFAGLVVPPEHAPEAAESD